LDEIDFSSLEDFHVDPEAWETIQDFTVGNWNEQSLDVLEWTDSLSMDLAEQFADFHIDFPETEEWLEPIQDLELALSEKLTHLESLDKLDFDGEIPSLSEGEMRR
jgi:hypothetical protein